MTLDMGWQLISFPGTFDHIQRPIQSLSAQSAELLFGLAPNSTEHFSIVRGVSLN